MGYADINAHGISRHIKDVFESNELDEGVVCAEIAHTTPQGAIPAQSEWFAAGIGRHPIKVNEWCVANGRCARGA